LNNQGFLVKAGDCFFLMPALPEMAHMVNDAMRTVVENKLRNKDLNVPQEWVWVLTDVETALLFPDLDQTRDVIFEVKIPEHLPRQDQLQLYGVTVHAVIQPNFSFELDAYGHDFPIQAQYGIFMYPYCKAAGIKHYNPNE
jgi:hypothetical protein